MLLRIIRLTFHIFAFSDKLNQNLNLHHKHQISNFILCDLFKSRASNQVSLKILESLQGKNIQLRVHTTGLMIGGTTKSAKNT